MNCSVFPLSLYEQGAPCYLCILCIYLLQVISFCCAGMIIFFSCLASALQYLSSNTSHLLLLYLSGPSPAYYPQRQCPKRKVGLVEVTKILFLQVYKLLNIINWQGMKSPRFLSPKTQAGRIVLLGWSYNEGALVAPSVGHSLRRNASRSMFFWWVVLFYCFCPPLSSSLSFFSILPLSLWEKKAVSCFFLSSWQFE